MEQTPAYSIPKGFTGVVTDAYVGTGIVLAYVRGEALRGRGGGLRKFKSTEAAAKAVAKG